jgi:hypothetical protein
LEIYCRSVKVKGKIFPCPRPEVTEATEVQLLSFLTSALEGSEEHTVEKNIKMRVNKF